MGPRKRSKPNPKAEDEPVPEEPSLSQGTKLQRKDPLEVLVGEPLPLNKPEGVVPTQSSVIVVETVSAEDV